MKNGEVKIIGQYKIEEKFENKKVINSYYILNDDMPNEKKMFQSKNLKTIRQD